MKEKEFDTYLRRYKGRYCNLRRGDDGIWKIYGKYGEIGPYSPEKGLLGVWCMSEGLTKRKSSALQKKLEGIVCDFHQSGDIEFGAIFHESDLHKVAKIINSRLKPQFSPEALRNKRQAMLEARQNIEKSLSRRGF